MTRVRTAAPCSSADFSEKLVAAIGILGGLFWGFVLTDSALEQAGILPNLIINPDAYGFMTTQSMYPMLGLGVISFLIAGASLVLSMMD